MLWLASLFVPDYWNDMSGNYEKSGDTLIKVCDACSRVQCLEGITYCQLGLKGISETTKLTINELRILGLENPDLWHNNSTYRKK